MAIPASVVIPTWRRHASLQSVLSALGNQTAGDFDVAIVCDGPDRGFAPDTGALAAKIIIHDTNRGLPAARNTGVRESRGALVLFLDDDVVPHADWLAAHVARHAEQGPGAIVLGHLEEEYTSAAVTRRERMLRKRRSDGYESFFARCIANGGTFEFAPHCGNNSSLRRELFNELGGFDEQQRFMHEDLELGARARAAGVRFIYEPRARAVHMNHRAAESYDVERSPLAARSDLRRARHLAQPIAAQNISQLSRGTVKNRIRTELAWQFPDATAVAGAALSEFAIHAGSERLLGTGRSLEASAAYWSALRATGETKDTLRAATREEIPGIVMHGVSIEPVGEERRHHLGAARFEGHMRWLARSGWKTLDTATLAGTKFDRRSVLLTFDDGYADLHSHALPLLLELGLNATVFIVAGHIGGRNEWDAARGIRSRAMLTRSQLVELHANGIRIGSHSMTHAMLTSLDDRRLETEVRDSKSMLEDIISAPVTTFAYPAGQVDERVRNAVASAGYEWGFGAHDGFNHWKDPMILHRTSLSQFDSTAEFALKLATGRGSGSHARSALIASTKLALSILPRRVRERLTRAAVNADDRARARTWQKRDEELRRT